jgi:hypothetical protein
VKVLSTQVRTETEYLPSTCLFDSTEMTVGKWSGGGIYGTSLRMFYACITMSKTALIIVDVQYDFLPPSGALAVPEGNQIIPRIKDLLSTDTGKWRSVIATQVRPSTSCNSVTDGRIITLKGIYRLHPLM